MTARGFPRQIVSLIFFFCIQQREARKSSIPASNHSDSELSDSGDKGFSEESSSSSTPKRTAHSNRTCKSLHKSEVPPFSDIFRFHSEFGKRLTRYYF